MDLPTYTSIWRIEKRLYKLYDFRLPMPLPIGQITVFAAIAVPYVVLLTLLGLPFSHTIIWLYVLPPGVATWLFTRPVLESKRLPELIRSQLRYLTEPRVWCRMAPLAESDVVLVTARIWRLSPAARRGLEGAAVEPAAAEPARSRRPIGLVARENAGVFSRPGPQAAAAGAGSQSAADRALPGAGRGLDRPVSQPRPMRAPTAPPTRPAWSAGRSVATPPPAVPAPASAVPAPMVPAPMVPAEPVLAPPPEPEPALMSEPDRSGRVPAPEFAPEPEPSLVSEPAAPAPAETPEQAPAELTAAAGAQQRPGRPVVTVVGQPRQREVPPTVEHALAGPSARRGDGHPGKVTVVPGGHRPGKPDQLQRDRSRAQLPIEGQRRVLVLGCTVGAGQTVTTLLLGEVLASLRPHPIAVFDLNPGSDSLAKRALARPALSQAASLGSSRLAVLAAGPEDQARGPIDPATAATVFEQASREHQIVLADPSTAVVPRMLTVADQLVLVAPASATAAQAIGMTFEWLDAHGRSALSDGAIMVMNGVSRRSTEHVEHAERVCRGQCRAIVRVPWDDQLGTHSAKRIPAATAVAPATPQWAGLLSPATAAAYTALAGVLVAALTGPGAGPAAGRVPR